MCTESALHNPSNVALILFYNQLVGSLAWNHMVNIYISRCLCKELAFFFSCYSSFVFVQDYMKIGRWLDGI